MIPGDFRLLVGLGNPGSKYTGTRHNIGFLAIEKFANKKHLTFKRAKKLNGYIAEIGFGENAQRILMPTTYMNESGQAIRAALDWFNLSTDQLLVVVDDMDLPLGRMRLRSQGSSGGHNGLRSIIQHLGTEKFCRIRVGIGAPTAIQEERKSKTIPHVLGRFTSKELQIVDAVLNELIEGLDIVQDLGVARAGTRLNSYQPQEFKHEQ